MLLFKALVIIPMAKQIETTYVYVDDKSQQIYLLVYFVGI